MQNPLFNPSFLKKKLAECKTEIKDNSAIFQKWHNDTQKEEALQTDFLNDIFGKILGYEIDTGTEEFNLLKEYKTQKDGTKVDGVLGFITKDKKDIRVAIELKAKNTKNLDTVEKQAFEYRDKIDGIEWVITSNTEEIRLYSAKSGGRLKYQIWTMLKLANSIEKQKEFQLLLSKDNLFTKQKNTSQAHKLVEDSIKEEESIEKRFYKDYTELRLKLFNHLREQNPEKDPINLLTKTQKLLDRIVFVCFCEDLNFLPNNIFTKLLKATQESFVETTIWEQVKGLFNAIDKGYPQKNINKFNGGLFAKDAELDSLTLQDELLTEVVKISDWDFASELSVNILGHIFEQSITDLEEIKAEIENTSHDKKQGKRKKDGVFYTPEYITRYIVEEAVGGWLNDKKQELKLDEIEPVDISTIKKTKKWKNPNEELINRYKQYATILENIKILDPACGSGAFLVAVFEFLENQWIQLSQTLRNLGEDGGIFQRQRELFSSANIYSIMYKHILKNNIYGVDLNPESTQITKLSLWLKTASLKEELTSLGDNIKCGNSLIDDPAIDQKAFKWEEEFPFKFDVVVGNPPYVNVKLQSELTRDFIRQNYHFSSGADLYIAFIEKAYTLINHNSYLSMIVPNKFFGADYGKNIRQLLQNNNLSLCKIWDLKDEKVFKSASISTIACVLKKTNSKYTIELKCKDNIVFIKDIFDVDGKIQTDINTQDGVIINKIKKFNNLQEYADVRTGIMGLEYWDKKDIIYENDKDKGLPLLVNGNFNRYENNYGNEIALYKQKYYKPYISLSGGKLSENTINLFSQKKIICRGVSSKVACIYDDIGHGMLVAVHAIIPKDKQFLSLLAILNSKLINWYHIKTQYSVRIPEGSLKYSIDFFKNIPIPTLPPAEQTLFIEKAQQMLDLTKQLNEIVNGFYEYLLAKLGNPTKDLSKLKNWHKLDNKGFLELVNKIAKAQKISIDDEVLLGKFKEKISITNDLQGKISQTDTEIDKMVYEIYGLSEEEIKIVEG